jgi:hypothetical protein
VEALQEAVVADIARARELLANSQVVEYREYLGACRTRLSLVQSGEK